MKMMSGPGLDWTTVEKLMHADDDRFEDAVSSLTVRELLDLVTGLQQAMADEQRRFDELSLELQTAQQKSPGNEEGPQHRSLSAALCASQLKLARLCARNMRCFTQQAIRAKEDRTPGDARLTSSMTSAATSRASDVGTRFNGDFMDDFQTVEEELKGSKMRTNTLLDISDFDEVEAAFSSMMDDDEPHSLMPSYDGRFHDEDDVMEADYDSRDFVVHRNTFNSLEDCNSEDGSSVTHGSPRDRLRRRNGGIPSPDYGSSEEEGDYQVYESGVSDSAADYAEYADEDEVDFVDNSASYAQHDPRRYVYYPEEKELEVIPEEDEEDLLDDSRQGSARGSYCDRSYEDDEEDSRRLTAQTECDSGVTDDQRSSGEEDELNQKDAGRSGPRSSQPYCEDTDSAQGSLLLEAPDSPASPVPVIEEPPDEPFPPPPPPLSSVTNKSFYKDDGDAKILSGSEESESESTLGRARVKSSPVQNGGIVEKANPIPHESTPKPTNHNPSEEKQGNLRAPSSKLAHLIKNFENITITHQPPTYSKPLPSRQKFVSSMLQSDSKGVEQPLKMKPEVEHIIKRVTLTEVPKEVPKPVEKPPLKAKPVSLIKTVTITEIPKETVKDVPVRKTPAVRVEVTTAANGSKRSAESNGVLAGRGALETVDSLEEERQPRSPSLGWDPTELLKELYEVETPQQYGSDSDVEYINMEGYLDMMPSNRKKATYWNPWKRRFFRLHDGLLTCFENENSPRPFIKAQLMGGNIDTLENNMIGIDDRKGHYIAVKCNSDEHADAWLTALHSQCQENFARTFVQPIMYPPPSHKDVIIVDLGGCSIRAGILMEQPTMPTVFFPSVCSTHRETGHQTFGIEALMPEVRRDCNVSFPLVPSAKISKFTMDVEALPGLMKKVFYELSIKEPSKYKVLLCIPRSFSLQTQAAVARVLLEDLGVQGLNLTHQAICALYAYNTSSGIIVDVGDRIDIVPITDGYIVESGVTRLPYGANKIAHHLRHALAQKRVSLFSDVELYLVRYVQQLACYIADDYKRELQRFQNDPDSVEKVVEVRQFFQDECPVESVSVDVGRFQAPEGLFRPELWGQDGAGLHKLVHRAVQECSMDIRREMARSIYLSGAGTLLPGLPQRLESELDALLPSSVSPKVHASPYREHMAFLGASTMASTSAFDEVCISRQEWRQRGTACLSKWHL
ncbi:uncharacterized protein LOC135399259 isoform X2 [Ornithodoros turicata]|uniref:uncharacterized protein LOC135399259 isoform X2 n=1 Tax=Ornithodoros turicata TaxID=34597 RepID=UPI003139232A